MSPKFKKGKRYSLKYINQICAKNNYTIKYSDETGEHPSFIVTTIDEVYYFSLSTTHGYTGGSSFNYNCN